MKSLLVLIILSSMATAYASSCTPSMDEANSRSFKAQEHANNVFSKLSEDCAIAVEGRMSAYLAALNYQRAVEAYSIAEASCAFPTNEEAKKLGVLSMDAYFSSRTMVIEMDKYLTGTCGQKPLGQFLL